MADGKISSLALATNLAANTRILVVTSVGTVSQSYAAELAELFGNILTEAAFHRDADFHANVALLGSSFSVSANTSFTGANTHVTELSANAFTLANKMTPASSSIQVEKGRVFFDDDYLYIATANNQIRRASLSSF